MNGREEIEESAVADNDFRELAILASKRFQMPLLSPILLYSLGTPYTRA